MGPVDGSRGMIDALHHAARLGRSRSLDAARELIETAGVHREPTFFPSLEAVLEVLPVPAGITGIELKGEAAAAGGDFDALYNLHRLAWADKIDEPAQLDMWRDLGGDLTDPADGKGVA